MLRALRRVWQPPCRQWLNRFFFFPFPCWWKIFFSRFIILQVFLPRFASSCLFPCVSAGADGRAALGTAARLGPGQLPGWHTHGGDVAACPCRALCAWLRETFRNYPCPWICLAQCSSPGVGSHGGAGFVTACEWCLRGEMHSAHGTAVLAGDAWGKTGFRGAGLVFGARWSLRSLPSHSMILFAGVCFFFFQGVEAAQNIPVRCTGHLEIFPSGCAGEYSLRFLLLGGCFDTSTRGTVRAGSHRSHTAQHRHRSRPAAVPLRYSPPFNSQSSGKQTSRGHGEPFLPLFIPFLPLPLSFARL